MKPNAAYGYRVVRLALVLLPSVAIQCPFTASAADPTPGQKAQVDRAVTEPVAQASRRYLWALKQAGGGDVILVFPGKSHTPIAVLAEAYHVPLVAIPGSSLSVAHTFLDRPVGMPEWYGPMRELVARDLAEALRRHPTATLVISDYTVSAKSLVFFTRLVEDAVSTLSGTRPRIVVAPVLTVEADERAESLARLRADRAAGRIRSPIVAVSTIVVAPSPADPLAAAMEAQTRADLELLALLHGSGLELIDIGWVGMFRPFMYTAATLNEMRLVYEAAKRLDRSTPQFTYFASRMRQLACAPTRDFPPRLKVIGGCLDTLAFLTGGSR